MVRSHGIRSRRGRRVVRVYIGFMRGREEGMRRTGAIDDALKEQDRYSGRG